MSTAGSTNKSLFARPAAASNQAPDDPLDHTIDLTIDLTLLDAAFAARRRRLESPPSRRSLWLAVRPVATEATRPLPPGLFSLTARRQ